MRSSCHRLVLPFELERGGGEMPNPKRIHVTKDGDQWKATREGADRASATADTQAEVERREKEIAAKSGGGEVVTHRPGGPIRDSDTIAPAKEPFPPRDTKH